MVTRLIYCQVRQVGYYSVMSINPDFRIPQWTIADRLRKAREHVGLDQAEFAQAIGVSRATVSNNERGIVHPRKIVLNAWALRTTVPIEWLETGNAPTDNPDGGPGDNGVTIEYRSPWLARRALVAA